jgi:hypothetical protein
VGDLARGRTRSTRPASPSDRAGAPAPVRLPLTLNNRLRTGADKGNPTV